MGRWQRFLSRFFPPESDLVAQVDASEDGSELSVSLAVPTQESASGSVVTRIDLARGRVRTREGQRRLTPTARQVVAALAPDGAGQRITRTDEGVVRIGEQSLPGALQALRSLASVPEASLVTETPSARAIKLAERRPLQYEFQVDVAGDDSLTVMPQIVSSDGKVCLSPDALRPPDLESPGRGRRQPQPQEAPRWVRQGKTYYPAPTPVAPDVAEFTQAPVVVRGEAVPFFLLRQLKQLQRNGRVVQTEAARQVRVASDPLEPVGVVDLDDEGWLQIGLHYRGGDETFSAEDIAALPPDAHYIRRGSLWVPVDRKADARAHEALATVQRTLSARPDEQGRLRVTPGQGDEARRVLLSAVELDEGAAFQKFLADLAGFRQIDRIAPPKGLRATLRPYQVEGFRWLAFLRKYYLNGVLADDMGLGKAQPLDTKILTPTGWKRMGDIHVGDAVINSQGGTSHVTGVYPQGEKDIYRVEFTDGSATECCNEHLWYVNTALRRDRGYSGRVHPLETIRQSLKDPVGNNQHFIPLVEPIEFEEGYLPLDPYLLGALVGDGSIIYGAKFSCNDPEILERMSTVLPGKVRLKQSTSQPMDWRISGDVTGAPNAVIDALRELGLMGCSSHTKFIPDPYKFVSVQTRIELLRGLMDTDGSISDNVLEFSSVSEQLIEDVQFIIQSLGGVARKHQKRTTWTHKGEHKEGIAYRLTIAMPGNLNPFWLKRKADLWKPREKYPPVRAFKSVTYMGKKPAQCIAVDAPDHLYVTDECIVTHNTVQLLSLLQYAKEHPDADVATPSIIICPTTVVDTWLDEAQKFAPDLRLARYSGTDRARALAGDHGKPPDAVVTSYETLRRDMGALAERSWDYVILDEAQKIKNPITDTARACRHLLARHRLAVTGTPVENRLDELWALFDFLMPGYLGSQARFRRDFEGPITRDKSLGAADELKRKIAPFVLRRMKEQVASDLPPKLYVTRECQLTREQSAMYARVAGEGRERVLEQARGHGNVTLTMSILASLTHLKQICCHPALLEGDPREAELHGRSGKFEAFKEVLAGRLEIGEKVLVFSQFAEMCHLIDRYLHQEGIPSLYLDGQTRNRQDLVRAFQSDPNIRVFVLSLRAAGFGITLTAASTVIHYDRWWNPAVENQATDRAYRIGQRRSVQVVQFQAVDTIEEKIDRMLTSKSELFGDVIETDLGGKKISRQELLDLFAYSPLRDSPTEESLPVVAPVAAR